MTENDKWNMVLDDTAAIGCEPIPETSEKDIAFMAKAKALKDKYMKK